MDKTDEVAKILAVWRDLGIKDLDGRKASDGREPVGEHLATLRSWLDLGTGNEISQKTRLGKLLVKMSDRHFGNLKIVSGRSKARGTTLAFDGSS